MPKQNNQEMLKKEESDMQSQNKEIGQATCRDYISLRKVKPSPLTQNQNSIQLFRNEELNKYLSEFQKQDKNDKKKHKFKSSDPKHLKCGWNVCLTGGMDKMDILDQVTDHLEESQENVFVVRGYAQPINQKKLYNAFGSHLISSGFETTINSVLIKDQLSEYADILSKTPSDTIIYVVFYDLSNYGFLSSQLQLKIASLLALPRLRVIASIDNCKIVLHWSFITIQLFNFVFINCNRTCIPITKLIKFLPLRSEKAQKTELQVIQLWKSLNINQRQIVRILAENELSNINSLLSEENYLSFQELLDACVDKIILSDDHQLRENLIELIDHRLIIEEIDKTKNKKVFIMKLDRRILENIVQGTYGNQNQAR